MDDIDAPSGYQVERVLSAYQAARARLVEDDPSLADDEAALVDLLGPEDGEVQDILARLLRGALHARDMAAAAKARLKAMKGRQERYEARAEHMQTAAFNILQITGERRFELPDLLATIRHGPRSVFITDETALPELYWRVATERTPDKKLLGDVMKLKDQLRETVIAEAAAKGMPVDERTLPEPVPGAVWANGADFLMLKGS